MTELNVTFNIAYHSPALPPKFQPPIGLMFQVDQRISPEPSRLV